MVRIFIRFQITSHSAALAVFACRISGVYTEFQLIADGDILLDLDISRISTDSDSLKAFVDL